MAFPDEEQVNDTSDSPEPVADDSPATAGEPEQTTPQRAVPAASGGRLTVGIDLGTCRTVILADNGQEFELRSVVGYPKDVISRQAVGDGPLFGAEALDKRNFLELCSPLSEGVIREASERDYRAARELVHHLVALIKADHPGVEVNGVIGVPARASLMNKEVLLDLAREVMDRALVVSEPFMVAYALGRLNRAIIVDIGAGTVDICGVKGSLPAAEDQITTFKGGDYLDERLEAAITRRHPGAQLTLPLACRLKEEHAFVGEPETPVTVTLRVEGKPVQLDITEELRTVCESMVPNIVEQLEILIASFDPEDQEEVLRHIYLAGCGSRIRGLDTMIASALRDYGEVRVTRVDDPERIGAAGALKLASEIPSAQWAQVGLMFGG
ncbi:MAG: MamK family actin-like protein [Desulfurivibrio sp.]|nr:MamK family actin-like protein [Desulfurivibrio sp.]